MSVGLFLFGALLVVVMGAFPALRPAFDGKSMGMAHTIECDVRCWCINYFGL